MVQGRSLPECLQLQALAALTLAEAEFTATGTELEPRLEMLAEGYTAEELGNGAVKIKEASTPYSTSRCS